jgi:hypothetical protein
MHKVVCLICMLTASTAYAIFNPGFTKYTKNGTVHGDRVVEVSAINSNAETSATVSGCNFEDVVVTFRGDEHELVLNLGSGLALSGSNLEGKGAGTSWTVNAVDFRGHCLVEENTVRPRDAFMFTLTR